MTEYREVEKDRESVCVREQEDEGESENEHEILRSEDEGGGVQTHHGIRVILLEKDSNFSPAPVPATTSSQNGHSCLGRAPLPAYLCICAWHTALRRSAAAQHIGSTPHCGTHQSACVGVRRHLALALSSIPEYGGACPMVSE